MCFLAQVKASLVLLSDHQWQTRIGNTDSLGLEFPAEFTLRTYHQFFPSVYKALRWKVTLKVLLMISSFKIFVNTSDNFQTFLGSLLYFVTFSYYFSLYTFIFCAVVYCQDREFNTDLNGIVRKVVQPFPFRNPGNNDSMKYLPCYLL